LSNENRIYFLEFGSNIDTYLMKLDLSDLFIGSDIDFYWIK